MNSRVRMRTCPTYTTLDIYTQTFHFVCICTNIYCKLIRRNLCVYDCVLYDTITTVSSPPMFLLLLLLTLSPRIQLPSSVHAMYGACTVTRVYICDDEDSISGIPSLGPYTDPEIEMSPYTATRQLLLFCVLIDAHQKRKKAHQHTHMRVMTVPHTQTYTYPIPSPTSHTPPYTLSLQLYTSISISFVTPLNSHLAYPQNPCIYTHTYAYKCTHACTCVYTHTCTPQQMGDLFERFP